MKKLSTNTARGLIRPIRKLCDAKEPPFTSARWKKIYSKFGKAPRTGKDKAYAVEQIKKLIGFDHRRIVPTVLTQAPSGCRVGAFQYLSIGDITPMYQNRREMGEKINEESPAIRDLFIPDKGARDLTNQLDSLGPV